MSADLIAWLRAQLDAREADARRRLADHTQYGPTELDPDDLLAEVDAKRAILDGHALDTHWCPMGDALLLALAQPYAGRDGWREEWRV